MQQPNICRLCKSTILSEVLHLATVPRNVLNMLDVSQLSLYGTSSVSISVLQCNCCGLVQTAQVLEDDHYTDFFWSASHIKQMVSHQKQQAIKFIEITI
jgi:hypothetical protein